KEGASGTNAGVFGQPIISGRLDSRGIGRVTLAGGLLMTHGTTQLFITDPIVIDTTTEPATITMTVGGRQVTVATFDLAAATVSVKAGQVTVHPADAQLTADGAA